MSWKEGAPSFPSFAVVAAASHAAVFPSPTRGEGEDGRVGCGGGTLRGIGGGMVPGGFDLAGGAVRCDGGTEGGGVRAGGIGLGEQNPRGAALRRPENGQAGRVGTLEETGQITGEVVPGPDGFVRMPEGSELYEVVPVACFRPLFGQSRGVRFRTGRVRGRRKPSTSSTAFMGLRPGP